MPPDIDAARATIQRIYERHGFTVDGWTGPLKCRVSIGMGLLGLGQEEAKRRIELAWKEIDAVVHEAME